MQRSTKRLPPWRVFLDHLRDVHTDLQRLIPYRDDGLVPNPGANPTELDELELRLGRMLPTAYREFLTYSNGWKRLFDGADLLSTKDLGDARREREARALFENALPDGLEPSRTILPFGSDAQGTTLFAFDYRADSSEPAVIAWVQEFGVVAASFAEFLEFLLALSRRDLAEHGALAVATQNGAPKLASTCAA